MGKLTTMRFKTKRRTKNVDQIFTDLSTPKLVSSLENQELQEDKPGLGQFYCVECARYFQNDVILQGHRKTKVHKRRLKLLKEGPYTQEEADAAGGTDIAKFANKKNKMIEAMNGKVLPKVQITKGTSHLKKNAALQVDEDVTITAS